MTGSKLKARWLRFWHCLWFTFADLGGQYHREYDLVQYPFVAPTRFLFGAPYKLMSISCECGKTFWERPKE